MKSSSFTRYSPPAILLAFIALILALSWTQLAAQENEDAAPEDSLTRELLARMEETTEPPADFAPVSTTPCVGGMAGAYPCNDVDLVSQLSHSSMGGGIGNDIWGWTDPLDGTEYALVASRTGTSFVDLSEPQNPLYLGQLPSHNGVQSTWRDLKVYADHVFIVADGNNGHGMQIFDLTQLRTVVNPPVTFSNTAHYSQIQDAHNIVINEDTGFAFIVGGTNNCSGGLHMIDISTPTSPTPVGCFDADGYTHDAQCVVYAGPDVAHQGREICFNSNEDTLTIVDVDNKAAPVQLSRTGYAGSSYTHQGWLTEDHTYFLLGDEADESNFGHNSRTYIWDVSDLDSPTLMGNYTGPNASIDHNLYIKGDYAFESNNSSGLRILDLSDVANANLTEAAFFDTYPADNNVNFLGQWSNYPYFASGIIIANDRQNGLFVLWPTVIEASYGVEMSPDDAGTDWVGQTVTYTVWITNSGGVSDTYDVSASDNMWTTSVSTDTVFLLDGDSASFEVFVDIPGDADNGDTDMATITAVSQNSPIGTNASTHLTTTAIAPVYSPSLATDQAEEALPGTTVTYTLWLTNSGNVSDTYDISASGEWTTAVSDTSVTLAVGAGTQIWLSAQVPADALYGAMDTAVLTATSINDPMATATANLTTSAAAVYEFGLHTPDSAQSSEVGTTVTYTVWLTNTGNATDTYDIMTSGVWTATLSVSSLGLAPGVSAPVEVWVMIPADAADSDMDVTMVTAVSQNSPETTATSDLTTTAELSQFIIYLPFLSQN